MTRDLFCKYIVGLYNDVPLEIYLGLISVFAIGLFLVLKFSNEKNQFQIVSKLLLIEYLSLLFCSTVLFRSGNEDVKYSVEPLWSYESIQDGNTVLIAENIMNVVAFIPIGFLLGSSFRRMHLWKVFILGICISATVEGLQFYYKRGFAEIDDVIHNTLGCLIGYVVYSLLRLGYIRVCKRYVAVC